MNKKKMRRGGTERRKWKESRGVCERDRETETQRQRAQIKEKKLIFSLSSTITII